MLRSRQYLLAVLFMVQVFNNLDGMALVLVVQDIKQEFSLSDTQLSLLTGLGFAMMYSFAGVAIARWADRGDRVAIISITAAIWSVLVAAYGMGRSFVQLLLLRGAVGISEAGCMPASQSLIADYFSRAERPQANAVYMIAGSITGLVGYSLAGWLNQLYGWRVMFMILGLPGVVVAALTWFTLRDPRFELAQSDVPAAGWLRHATRSPFKITAGAEATPLKEAAITLWSNATLRQLLFFWSAWTFLGYGLNNWWPAYFMRSYHLNTGEVGTWFAVAIGLGGTVGPLLGSAWISRYAVNNERLQLRAMGASCCGITILAALIYLAPNEYVAFGLVGLYSLLTTALCGPFWSMLQTLVPEDTRAAVIAMVMLLGSLIGNGLGPFTTGALSDTLGAQLGVESLRYASLALCPGYFLVAWYLWRASKSVTGDLAVTQGRQACLVAEDRTLATPTTLSL